MHKHFQYFTTPTCRCCAHQQTKPMMKPSTAGRTSTARKFWTMKSSRLNGIKYASICKTQKSYIIDQAIFEKTFLKYTLFCSPIYFGYDMFNVQHRLSRSPRALATNPSNLCAVCSGARCICRSAPEILSVPGGDAPKSGAGKRTLFLGWF